jgi:hypothetical protein
MYQTLLRRDGRVVECTALEMRRTARYRGFESHSLRQNLLKNPLKSGFFVLETKRAWAQWLLCRFEHAQPAHVGPQRFWHRYRAIGLLVVLQYRHQGASNGQT